MAEHNKSEKYALLNRLSTEQLEELLRADIESSESGDEDVIFHILEVIEKREEEHPSGRLPDEERAWADFQQYYNIPEGDGLSLYPYKLADNEGGQAVLSKPTPSAKPIRPHHWLKQGFVAAAVVVALLGGMVAAQAAGIDVFGAIARWTDETFHFIPAPSGGANSGTETIMNSGDDDYYDLFTTALLSCGITEELSPMHYPAGFEASEPKVVGNKLCDIVNLAFHGDRERFFSVSVMRYRSASGIGSLTFEKDGATPEQYTSGTKTFYIFSNEDTITAAWSEGLLVETIAGNLTLDEIKDLINSI